MTDRPSPDNPEPSGVHASGATRPRVLFYCHDSYGLGHVRRTLNIAAEIARRRPDVSMLLLTGASRVSEAELPASLDYVRLPSTARSELYADLAAPAERGPMRGLLVLRKALLRQAVEIFAPDLVLVEFLPGGLWGELKPALDALRSRPRRVALVLGLRDVLDPPEEVRRSWHRGGCYDLLETAYDRILIYGCPEVLDAEREYAFPPSVVDKTVYCGYVTRPDPVQPAGEIRQRLGATGRPLVAVTTGGGTHGGPLLRAYVDALRAGLLPEVVSLLTLGPLLDRAERASIEAACARQPDVTAVTYEPDLPSYLNAADLVVTMAGYNATAETLRLGKRAVLVPRVHPHAEQRVRAERLAARGLARMLHPDALTPATLACVVREALTAAPPRIGLDFGGLARVGEILAAALGREDPSAAS